MSVEIERRFLVFDPPALGSDPGTVIEQGYLVFGEEGAEVRIRRADTRCTLTVKRGLGLLREETEIEISTAQFEALWPRTGGWRLVKRRYAILATGGTIELDVYEGPLAGLIVAEIEFPSIEASRTFVPPRWCDQEVTEDSRFRNRNVVSLSAGELSLLLRGAGAARG